MKLLARLRSFADKSFSFPDCCQVGGISRLTSARVERFGGFSRERFPCFRASELDLANRLR